MSLDVSLKIKTPVKKTGTGIYIRENGKTKELTLGEAMEKFPNAEINEFEYETEYVFEGNITHNLGKMASMAGIYEALWRPHRLKEGYNIPENDHDAEHEFEINSVTTASEILPIIESGFADMEARPEYYKQFNPENGWGNYDIFIRWIEIYINACREYPDAIVEVDR